MAAKLLITEAAMKPFFLPIKLKIFDAIGAKIKVPQIIKDIGKVLAQPVSINWLPIIPLNNTVITGANDAIVELKKIIIKFLLNIHLLLCGMINIHYLSLDR